MAIKKIRIHPAIGIARLGNSPEGFFIGPEIPGIHPSVSSYRDDKQQLKRQAARFRLFAYDYRDDLIGEISLKDSRIKSIQWTVHLKNTKAAGPRFAGILHQKSPRRNLGFPKKSLILDGTPTCIEGIDKRREIHCKSFMNRNFSPELKLGTLRTDKEGRLLVLGGHGESGTLIGANLEKRNDDFANHDGWYDDTSDGPVHATVTWKNCERQSQLNAEGAWVIVAPPKYAPSLASVVTLYDLLYQKTLDDYSAMFKREKERVPRWQKRLLAPVKRPSFMKHIYPILRRAYEMRWVFARAEVGHEDQFDLARASHRQFEEICENAAHIVRQFREPSKDPRKPGLGTGKMPYIWSDLFDMDDTSATPHPVNGTLTRHQYDLMQQWANGNFDADWKRTKTISKAINPEGLDRAALEACVGAALFPGIETSFHIRDKFEYVEPFRLDAKKLNPGDVTQQMSLPWQTDFVDCNDGDTPYVWWPAQRPIDVRLESQAPQRPAVRWARDFDRGEEDLDSQDMVRYWWRLGLIKPSSHGPVETQRVNRISHERTK
jgi:hypothetical protein